MEKERKSSLLFRLTVQCAPLFLGIKPAELFSISKDCKEDIQSFLKGTEISSILLGGNHSGQVFLLYQKGGMKRILNESSRKKFLLKLGYPKKGFEDQLAYLKERFQQYSTRKEEFPHEIGLFLGYPVEDIQGFIQKKGRDYLYCGYWKVYSDVKRAKKMFETYDKAKFLMYFIASGKSVEEDTKDEYCDYRRT